MPRISNPFVVRSWWSSALAAGACCLVACSRASAARRAHAPCVVLDRRCAPREVSR